MESLRKINSPFIKEVRGYGLMIGVEIDLEKCFFSFSFSFLFFSFLFFFSIRTNQ